MIDEKEIKKLLRSRYSNMMCRCYKQYHGKYKYYGGRGISVCERWEKSFENFYEDMKHGFSPELSIDRINNDGNYESSNCRWATRIQQAANKRKPVYKKRAKKVKPIPRLTANKTKKAKKPPTNKVTFRLSPKNYQKLKSLSKQKGLSQNSYIESLIAKAK